MEVSNVIVIILLGVAFGREMVRRSYIDAQIQALQTEVDTLASSNSRLAELQSALQTESFIEREARLKLGLKKPGESVVVIKDQDKTNMQGTVSTDPSDPLNLVIDDETSSPSLVNATKWWYYFFDRATFNKISDL